MHERILRWLLAHPHVGHFRDGHRHVSPSLLTHAVGASERCALDGPFSQHSQVNMVVWFGISMCVMYIPIIGKETEHAYKS